MSTITLWLLLATSGKLATPAMQVIERFTTPTDCQAAADRMEAQAKKKTGRAYVYGTCVEAKVYKP